MDEDEEDPEWDDVIISPAVEKRELYQIDPAIIREENKFNKT